jgi:hypothetical protein
MHCATSLPQIHTGLAHKPRPVLCFERYTHLSTTNTYPLNEKYPILVLGVTYIANPKRKANQVAEASLQSVLTQDARA